MGVMVVVTTDVKSFYPDLTEETSESPSKVKRDSFAKRIKQAVGRFFLGAFRLTSDHRIQPSVSKISSGLKNLQYFQDLMEDDKKEGLREIVVPNRRNCSSEISADTIFITDKEIIKVHPIQFLRHSPFVEEYASKVNSEVDSVNADYSEIIERMTKQIYAIGQTQEGKHVILQQGSKTCFPTCVGMLLLDHGKTPNYRAIQQMNLARENDAMDLIELTELEPILTTFNTQNKLAVLEILMECLERNGPGILTITHPVIKGHAIILDELSKESNRAIIRDPFHGWMLTIKISTLFSWLVPEDNGFDNSEYRESFVQIKK